MIAVDIGNTNLHFAWFKKEKITKTLALPVSRAAKPAIQKILSKYPNENILICSVVPKITGFFKSLKNQKVYIAGKDIKVPIRYTYNEKEIGMDRLVGAFAAKTFFPKTRIVLDFGTAITLDFLSKQGIYQGGIILPGIGSTLKSFAGCAMLPKRVKFKKTKKIIPCNTKDSINKGIEEGFSSMINSLVKKYIKRLKISIKEKIVITGGEARLIMPKLNIPCQYEPFLVLKGLWLLDKYR